jgi:RNA polymerase sigma-70 factor, ECF subfamily
VAVSRSAKPSPLSAAPASASRPAELPDELDGLYAQYFDFVWRTLRRLGVPFAELDDAAQDVFIVLLRRRGEFRGQSSYRTWLFGIAHNVAHEYRRKRQRAALDSPVSDEQRAERPSPLEQASSNEALRLLDRFLATLDDDKRAVFVSAELEQMSAPEIASALGVKLNTVYSRLRAARQAFFALLEQHAKGEP